MTAEPLPAGPAPAGPWPAGPLPAGPGPAEPEPAEPAWLTEVRLRAGRRALWLRFLWAAHRYPGEDAMAISHSEVDRAIESALRPGELARAERRFYREDPAAAVVSETLGRLLAAGPDARWDHLTRALGLSVPDASLLALALAAEAAPEMRRVYGYLSDDTGPVDASPALARALWAWAPGLRVDAGSALLRWRLAWPRDASPDWFAADSRWVADPLLLAELTGDDPGARCGPAGRDVELTAEAVLYPAALEEIVGFAGSLSAVSWPAPGSAGPTAGSRWSWPGRRARARPCWPRKRARSSAGASCPWTRRGWPVIPTPWPSPSARRGSRGCTAPS